VVKISVITPTKRKGIGINFQGLVRQTFKDFEWIIIDELYPMRFKLVTEFWKRGINMLGYYSPKKRPREYIEVDGKKLPLLTRICNALNTGLIHARGELICILDDNTYLPSDYLRRFWDAYLKYPHSFFSGVVHKLPPPKFDADRLDYEVKLSTPRVSLTMVNNGKDEWIRYDKSPLFLNVGGAFPLKAALEINGFDERSDWGWGAQDSYFAHRLMLAGWTLMHNDAVVCYHFRHPRDTQGAPYHAHVYLGNWMKQPLWAQNMGFNLKEERRKIHGG